MGKRGPVEDVTTRVAGALKASEAMSMAGVASVTIIFHPRDGLIFSGEDGLTRKMINLVEREGLEQSMAEVAIRQGSQFNHFSTRREKEGLLAKLYDCNLPPLPLPFEELQSTSIPVLSAQFGKVLEVELGGSKYKTGQQLPDNISEWFTFGPNVFDCIKGSTYSRELPGLLSYFISYLSSIVDEFLEKNPQCLLGIIYYQQLAKLVS